MTGTFKTDARLCCIWQGDNDSTVNSLVYGDKRIRTYLPGRVDGRLHGTPVLNTAVEVVRHLLTTKEPCLVPVRHCKILFGWKERDFAQPDWFPKKGPSIVDARSA